MNETLENSRRTLPREKYLTSIRSWIGQTEIVKVYTGERRSGKSGILQLIRRELEQENIHLKDIVYWNSEEHIITPDASELYEMLHGYRYIFLDEIQEVKEWERTIRKLLTEGNHDIHITGLNATLLSSELSTTLSGRYRQFEIWPLSYEEFLIFHSIDESPEAIDQFCRYGGLPYLSRLSQRTDDITGYLSDVIDSIVLRDIVGRYGIRNIDFFRRLLVYLADHIGDIFSAYSISIYLKSQKTAITPQGILNYLEYAQNAYLIHRVDRYDILGKRVFEVREKYFFTDLGIRNQLSGGYRDRDLDGILENLVYLELRKAGWKVFVGEIAGREIDFVADRAGEKIYIQCMLRYTSRETWDREVGAFSPLSDAWPRYIISLDDGDSMAYDGVVWMNVRDFIIRVLP